MSRETRGCHQSVTRLCLLALVAITVAATVVRTVAGAPQSDSGRFAGVLQDPTGRRIPLASLALIEVGTGRKILQESTDSGQFGFSNLAAGTYRFEIAQTGFVRDLGLVTLAPGQQIKRTVTPEVGTIAEVQRLRMEWARSGKGPSSSLPVAPADPCGQRPPAGCLSPPVKLVNALPVYPAAHLQHGVSGQVRLTGHVGTNGRLEALKQEAGSDPAFTQAALEAFRLWRYTPARLGGVPVTCRIALTILFQE